MRAPTKIIWGPIYKAGLLFKEMKSPIYKRELPFKEMKASIYN